MLARLPELEDEVYRPEITLRATGKTCVCPFNGQTDTFSVELTYVPNGGRVLELEAFNRHLDGYSSAEIAHEVLTQQLLSDVLEMIVPAYCQIETVWAPVEGIECRVRLVAGG